MVKKYHGLGLFSDQLGDWIVIFLCSCYLKDAEKETHIEILNNF